MAVALIDLGANFFAYFGAIIIFYGGLVAVIRTILIELKRSSDVTYHDTRRDFTHKIVFGLDFLIASDILKTTIAPTREEITLLGAIVIIRTILGYFLTKEVSEFDGSQN